jgi:hypothetical protein
LRYVSILLLKEKGQSGPNTFLVVHEEKPPAELLRRLMGDAIPGIVTAIWAPSAPDIA